MFLTSKKIAYYNNRGKTIKYQFEAIACPITTTLDKSGLKNYKSK